MDQLAAPTILDPLHPPCYYLPTDPSYPTPEQWQILNTTVNGNLIALTPLATPCHQPHYNIQSCISLRNIWPLPETHYEDPASIMSNFFANNSCNPFLSPETPCGGTGYVSYSVRVRGTEDIKATVAFAKQNNIRLVIRNTGHDYLGKSNGAGSLAVWTHHLKNITFSPNYISKFYNGPAMTIGAGVQGFEARAAALKEGYVLVSGNCDTIGVAGGYTQGGGHGQLTSMFGLAADQVLEWEVMIASGEVVVARPGGDFDDLYWALSGGGGGVWGVVVSVTVRVYEEVRSAAATLTFSVGRTKGSPGDEGIELQRRRGAFRRAVEVFIAQLGPLLDERGAAVWAVTGNYSFGATPVSIPGGSKDDLQRLLRPVLSVLKEGDMPYSYYVREYATLNEAYDSMMPEHNLTELNGGGRFIPRSLLDSGFDGLTSSLWTILDSGEETVISGVSVNATLRHDHKHLQPENSVHPAWRDAAISLVVALPFTYTDWPVNLERQDLITRTLLPQLEELTPGGGAYLNEGNPNQEDWQRTFYGANYNRLLRVKRKYDPDGIFYALTGVGSESWIQTDGGRLCRVTT
ncbi:hypothetical protein BDW72DRAFT_205342 [Aspergillus terricola var. indicus]